MLSPVNFLGENTRFAINILLPVTDDHPAYQFRELARSTVLIEFSKTLRYFKEIPDLTWDVSFAFFTHIAAGDVL